MSTEVTEPETDGATIPKCIQKELEKLDGLRQQLLDYTSLAAIADAVLAEHRCSHQDYVTVEYARDKLQRIVAMLHVKHWNEVVPVLRAFAAKGFHQTSKPRDYFACHARGWILGQIEVCAFIPWDDSGQCRRVQTGTKEEPVYEWQCDNNEVKDEA